MMDKNLNQNVRSKYNQIKVKGKEKRRNYDLKIALTNKH